MRLAVAALLLLAGCAPAPGPGGLTAEEAAALDNAVELLDDEADAPLTAAELDAYPDARGMPADVQRFIVRWTDCQHFLGEPDYDDERRRQIAYAVSQVCPGIDAEGRRVRTRHAGDAAVIGRLRDYEPLGH